MKKSLILCLCIVLLLTSFCSCKGKKDVENLSCAQIVETLKKAYGADYSPNVAIPDEVLSSDFGLNLAEMESYYGEMPQIGLSCDRIVAVKAAKGEADTIEKRFEEAKKTFEKNSIEYSNGPKTATAVILTEGDFVCFFMLGADYGGEDVGEGNTEEIAFYEKQQQTGIDAWNSIFYNE